jgi:hypothetical protein
MRRGSVEMARAKRCADHDGGWHNLKAHHGMRKIRSWVPRSRQAFPGSWHDGFASSAGSLRAGPAATSLCACPLPTVRDPQCAASAARGTCAHRRSADRQWQGDDTKSPPTSDVPLRRITRADATGRDLARTATARSSCGRRSLEWASTGIIPLLGDLRRASTDRRPARISILRGPGGISGASAFLRRSPLRNRARCWRERGEKRPEARNRASDPLAPQEKASAFCTNPARSSRIAWR